jgi:hypothetical protein
MIKNSPESVTYCIQVVRASCHCIDALQPLQGNKDMKNKYALSFNAALTI